MKLDKSALIILAVALALDGQVLAQDFLTNGLVAYYPFNGNANDASGNGNNGTAVNGVTYVPDFWTLVADLNGNQQYISLPNTISFYQDLTVTFWTKTTDSTPNSWNNGLFLVSRDVPDAHYDWNICLGLGSKIQFHTGTPTNDSIVLTSADDLPSNQWVHVACVADSVGAIKKIFLDGQVNASATWSANPFDNNSMNINVGAVTDTPDKRPYFIGEFAGLRFYNRALSDNEVQQMYAYEAQATNPPSIQSQPQSITVNAGNNALFSVTATGSSFLSYQWSLNGINISGATSSTLMITNVTQSNLGDYAVTVTNAFGSVTSSNAMLSMYPFLATPFRGLVTLWGSTNTIGVVAWGTGPLTYQWFDNGVAIAGATNATLTFNSIQFTNAGLYSVVVSNPFGSVTNQPAQVVVNPAGVSLGMYPGVTLSGVVGYTYIIQGNPDLTNTNGWTNLAELTLIQPVQLWVDVNLNAASPNNRQRFYRVLPGQ